MSTSNNSIQAVNKKLIELLDKQKYQVDPFQREYKWHTEHIEELLVDLERAFMANFDADHTKIDASNYSIYYLGPIVLYEKDGAKHIIDGQQRLTSLTLILIYLNNLQKSILDKDIVLQPSDIYTMSKVILEETCVKRVGCMSGPNLAREIANKQPAATVIASKFDEVIKEGESAIRSKRLQVYGNHDIYAVELAGVLKNSMALAAGALGGLGYGQNAMAFLITCFAYNLNSGVPASFKATATAATWFTCGPP